MPQGANRDNDREEFRVKELQTIRDARSAELAALSASITKYHFLRVVSFFVIALLISGSDFRQPEWRRRDLALQAWMQQYGQNQYILGMPYYLFNSSKYPKNKRDELTRSIQESSSYKLIDPSYTMREVAQFLATNNYGINPLELPELREQIELIRDQKGAVTLSDLNNYHYEGGPFVQGTRLKDNFFSYVITKHPLLAKELPYIPSLAISEYLSSLETKIRTITEQKSGIAAWASYYGDYDFYAWNWYAWETIPDSAVVDWRSSVLDKFGPVPGDVIQKVQLKSGPDLEYIINYFKGVVDFDRDSEARSRERMNLGLINIDLPIAFILLTFPLSFFGASALFRAMETQKTLIAIDISEIEREIATSISAPPLRYVPQPETLKHSPYYLVVQGRFRELFYAFPSFFVDGTCRIIAGLAGAYILFRLCFIVFFSGISLLSEHDTLIAFGLFAFGIGINLAVLWICSRALADSKSARSK